MINKFLLTLFCFSVFALSATAQSSGEADKSQTAKAKSDSEIVKRALEWVTALSLSDGLKADRVKEVIVTHLKTIRDWNNEHPASTVPEGINPATGNKLSELDRQIIAISAMPKSVHENLMNGLRKDLDSQQVEMILDKYTIGKVAFTLNGYRSIVPDMTGKEEAYILSQLKLAREQAVDYKNMKQISAIFEIYKTKCEQYLNNNGRNWREMYKTYTDGVKKKKQEEKEKAANKEKVGEK